MFNLNTLVRPHILTLKPYSSARDEYQGTEGVFLDANENAFGTPGLPDETTHFHRYPDPYQTVVKQRLSALKQVPLEQIFLGNGSDEIIDLLTKAFCQPQQDNVVILPPTFGMYEAAAAINQVALHPASLTPEYGIDRDALDQAIDDQTKIIYFCSPNNPTGNLLDRDTILDYVRSFSGLVVVDEAYIDFAGQRSFSTVLCDHPNLVVLQTLSKAWGMAALRLGMAFASADIVRILNKVKTPYNINTLTQQKVLEVLQHEEEYQDVVKNIIEQRDHLREQLEALPAVERVHPSDANFFLVKVKEVEQVLPYLVEQKVIVRNRSNIRLCEGGLRITVGTPEENNILIDVLRSYPLNR